MDGLHFICPDDGYRSCPFKDVSNLVKPIDASSTKDGSAGL